MNTKTKELIICSLFAALTAILSQISIPLPFTPVPINLATISVLLSGALLKKNDAAISQLVYTLLGVVGLPVFANFSAGIGIIVGPTGGYILGYIATALIVGIIIEKFNRTFIAYILSMCIGIITCYTLGTLWYMFITKTNLLSSLVMCVLPFIPGDIIKIIICSILAKRLHNTI